MARRKKTIEPIDTKALKDLTTQQPNDRTIEHIMIGNAEGGGDRATAAVQLYFSNVPVEKICKETGYAVNSVYRVLKRYRENPEFRQRVANIADYMPEAYLTMKKLEVLRYHEADQAALKKYADDPELLIRHPGYMKQLKQSSGVLPSDNPAKTEYVVNIDKMQAFVQNILESPDDVIDLKQITQDDGTGVK